MSEDYDDYQENQQRILLGLRQIVSSGESLTRVELNNTTGIRNELVYGGPCDSDIDLENYSLQLVQEAHSDARAMGGEQSYAVLIYAGKDDKRPRKRIRFTAFERSQSWLLEQSPHAGGSVGSMLEQSQRHTEVAFQTMARATQGLLIALQKENARLSKDNEQLHQKHLEMLALQEELISHKHERELEALQIKAHEERKNEVVDIVRLHLPGLFDKTGRYLRGEKDEGGLRDTDVQAVTEIIRQLKPDQLQSLMGIFTPAQATKVIEIVQKVSQAEEKKNGRKSLPAKS